MATYIQVHKPDLTVKTAALLCLNFTWQVFGSKPGMGFTYAAEAWKGQKGRHTTKPPKGVIVPVWFSWTGYVGGVKKNWGHAAVSLGDGRVLSSPMTGHGQIITTIDRLETGYGMRYLGWSEYMDHEQVVEKQKLPAGRLVKRTKKVALHVRTDATLSAKVITTLKPSRLKTVSGWKRGTKVSGSDLWLRVRVKSRYGWAHASGFKTISAATTRRLKEYR